jgi:hypothetical protein
VINKHWKLVVAPIWGVHGKFWPNFMESYKKIYNSFCFLCASISAPTTIAINTHKLNNTKFHKFNTSYPNSIHLHKNLPHNVIKRIQIPYILPKKTKTKAKINILANTQHIGFKIQNIKLWSPKSLLIPNMKSLKSHSH